MVKQVGGDRVEVTTLVGPNGDAHVFSPTPADAKTLAGADIFFINGLGFEGWMERLENASGFKGALVVASGGVMPITMAEEEGHDHEVHAKGEDHDAADADSDHAEAMVADPHAWQNLFNGKIYVANIRDALIAADPDGKAVYEANAAKYLAAIDAEDKAVKAAIANLPPARRKIITSHDAFGYFGNAYGLEDHFAGRGEHRERGVGARRGQDHGPAWTMTLPPTSRRWLNRSLNLPCGSLLVIGWRAELECELGDRGGCSRRPHD